MARRLRPSRTIEPYYGEVVPGETRVVEETVTQVSDDSNELWPWLVGLGLVLLLVVGYVALQEDDDAVVVPVNSPSPVASVFIQQPAPQAPVIIQQPPAQQPPVIIQQPPAQQQSAPPPASQPAEPAPSAS